MTEAQKDLIEISALTRALNIFSDRWSFLILRDLFRGMNRYGHFIDSLNIPRQTLLNRLEMLADQKIIYKRPKKEGRIVFEYKLTPMGLDLYPYAILIWHWFVKYFPTETGLDSTLKHKICDQDLCVKMACETCNDHVRLNDILIETGPGAGMDLRPTQRKGRRSWSLESGTDGEKALAVVCDRWNNLILGAIFSDIQNFDGIQDKIGIAPNTLSDRLRTLVEMDLLKVKTKATKNRFAIYRPTKKAMDYFPCLFEMGSWGNRWLMGSGGPAAIPVHRTCEQILFSKVVCAHCELELHPHDVIAGEAEASNNAKDYNSNEKEATYAY